MEDKEDAEGRPGGPGRAQRAMGDPILVRGTFAHITDLATWPATRLPDITYHSANASPIKACFNAFAFLVTAIFEFFCQFFSSC